MCTLRARESRASNVWPQTIQGGGRDAVFGPPWAENEGVIVVAVPGGGRRPIVLRVMDEDWGHRRADDLLGEVCVITASVQL